MYYYKTIKYYVRHIHKLGVSDLRVIFYCPTLDRDFARESCLRRKIRTIATMCDAI